MSSVTHFRSITRWTERTWMPTSTTQLFLRYALVVLMLFTSGSYSVESASYMSRPDLAPPLFNVTVYNSSHVTPGYWFVALWAKVKQPAAYILDGQGNLVWSGFDQADTRAVFNFKPVVYNQSIHMSYFKGIMNGGTGHGNPVVMDSSYNTNTAATAALRSFDVDGHDFYVTNEGRRAIITAYEPVNYDLSAFNITTGVGWILESIFKEVDIETGKVLFEWRSTDHVDPSESAATSNVARGVGLSYQRPWDYFHINSVEKTTQGDYLISGRHMNCIYKVSGVDGSIIWKLGGTNSSFAAAGFNFSFQHDARIQEENSTTTIISFLDNDYNGGSKNKNFSSGMIVALDTSLSPMTARLINRYISPEHSLVSSQGNVQVLPNKNVFIGWGDAGSLSEFTSDGNCVLHARSMTESTSYRAFKSNFTGLPTYLPTMWTYALNKSSPTAFYVSWNGATEVAYWNFYAVSDSPAGSHVFLGRVEKSGFETTYMSSQFYAQGFAEAVAANGTSLANTTITSSFVPPSTLASACTLTKCVASKPPPKEAPPKKAPPKKAPPKKSPEKEASPTETSAKETPPAKETPAKKAPSKEAPAKEAPAKEAPAKEASLNEAPAKEAPPTKAFDPSPYLTSNTALLVVVLIMMAQNVFLGWRRFSKVRQKELDLKDGSVGHLDIPLLREEGERETQD